MPRAPIVFANRAAQTALESFNHYSTARLRTIHNRYYGNRGGTRSELLIALARCAISEDDPSGCGDTGPMAN